MLAVLQVSSGAAAWPRGPPGQGVPQPRSLLQETAGKSEPQRAVWSPHPAPADLQIPLIPSVVSQSALQLVPWHSWGMGESPGQPVGWHCRQRGSPALRGAQDAHRRQTARRHGRAEGLARHAPKGCSVKHKGSPILAALPWNAAREPLPSTNLFLIILPGCRLIPAPSPATRRTAPASSYPISQATSAQLLQPAPWGRAGPGLAATPPEVMTE